MDSFSQFWDKINGPMYQNVPPPVEYDFAKYIDSITQGPVANTEDGTHELTPIIRSDTASYAAEDVLDWYKKYGRNLTVLGPQMTDAELKKFGGQTW
jgi:hypothetical protein